MTLIQLQYFVTVCRHGNMTKAAEALHVSQPSISNAIKELEKEYQITLFVRGKSQLVTTYEGKMFLRYAKEILDKAEALNRHMSSVGNQKLRINMGISTSSGLLFSDLLEEFRALYPQVSLNVYSFGTLDLKHYVENDSLDVALTGTPRNSQLSHHTVFSAAPCLWTYRENPLARREVIHLPQDLQAEPLVLFKESAFQARKVQDLSKDVPYDPAAPNVLFCTNQLDFVKSYIRQRRASSIVLDTVARTEPQFAAVPIQPGWKIDFSIIWRKENLYPHVLEFIHFVKGRFTARRAK